MERTVDTAPFALSSSNQAEPSGKRFPEFMRSQQTAAYMYVQCTSRTREHHFYDNISTFSDEHTDVRSEPQGTTVDLATADRWSVSNEGMPRAPI